LYGQRENRPPKDISTQPNIPGQFSEDEIEEGQDSLDQEIEVILPDTAIIDYTFFDQIHRLTPFADTSLHKKSQFYDPARMVDPMHVHLGNIGSAAMPLAYQPKKNIGFSLGYNQYELYNLKKDSFRLYRVNRPFTSVFSMPSGNQENFIIKTKFARNFANNINVSLDYQRIKQPGVYTDQASKSTYVGAALWYRGPAKKYDLILSVISNSNNEEHNGGVSSKTLFDQPFYNFRERIPVTISDAATRQNSRNYSVNNYYHLLSNDNKPWKFSLRHELAYIRKGYKSFDTDVTESSDNTFYGQLIVDSRGLRNQTKFKQLQNSFFVILDNSSGFNAQTGISYTNYNINHDGNKFTKNSLQAHFNGTWSLKKTLSLNAQTKIGLLDYIGDLDLSAELAFQTKNIGTLKGKFHFNRSSPSLVHQELYLSQIPVWINDYDKPIISSVSAEYILKSIGLKLSLSQTIIDKPLYFDNSAISQQLDGTLSISSIGLEENIKLGIFHLDNQFHFQHFDQKIYPLPNWFSTHSLYIQTRIFKQRMLLKTGFDTRLIEEYFPPSYMHLIGQFHLQEEETEQLFFLTDFFVNFKISRFIAFVRLENVTDFMGNRIFYQVNNYPQFDFRLKIGVNWSLFD
jgi:hypothetical protein